MLSLAGAYVFQKIKRTLLSVNLTKIKKLLEAAS